MGYTFAIRFVFGSYPNCPPKRYGKKETSENNKSQASRDFVTENPGVGPTEAAAKLSESLGVKVTPQTVSSVKFQMKKAGPMRGRKSRIGRRATANGHVGFNEMLAAKELAAKVGGVEQAKQALEALAKLQQ